MTETTRRKLTCFVELLILITGAQFFPDVIRAAAVRVHVTLPDMPLIHGAYLYFIFTLLALLWVLARGETLADFGLIVPKRWLRTILQGLAVFAVILVYDIALSPILKSVIGQLTHTSTQLAEQHFAGLKGRMDLFLFLIPFVWIFGAFGEEILYRGLIMTRLAQLMGSTRGAWIGALVIQALLFGLGHAYQGPAGMADIAVIGLIYGAGTLVWGRNLWPAMIAHGVLDTFGFFMMYAGLAGA
jgi:membrane protease YdiL (CAAX protease family)